MTTITVDALSADSMTKAADRVRKYARAIANKNRQYVKELTDVGMMTIEQNLNGQTDPGAEMPQHNHPHVLSGSKDGEVKATLKLTGKNVLFVEFGAGIHYNTPAGTSPHPLGEQLGYTIGSYGYGNGAKEYWVYIKDGKRYYSMGTEATMPMWKASQEMRRQAKAKAKSSFNIKGI